MKDIYSTDADSLYKSGVSAYQNNDLTTALQLVLEAIKISSNMPEYYNTFGVILSQAGSEESAVKAYKKAIELNNNYEMAYNNLGNCLQKQNKYAESIEHYAKAIELNPGYAQAYNNIAAAFYKLGNFDDAIENCHKAIEIKHDYAEAYNTLAAAFQSQQKFDEAIECYDKTIEHAPEYAEAYYSRGMLYLCRGDFAKGWPDYQWRLKTAKTKLTLQNDRTWWQGENFQGKTLLVQAEQGFGDSMQFVRYLPLVKERGGKVIFAEKPELVGLFKNLEGVDDLVDIKKVAEGDLDCDLYVTLLSLPMFFATKTDNIPAAIPYLFAQDSKVTYWQNKIKTDAFKVGITWAGNPTHNNDRNRSCTLDNFTQLAKIKNVKLFSLQKGTAIDQINDWPADIEMINLGREFADFTDTAAAIENMDMIISVDTSVIHLAGAMGKNAILLLPQEPDWRWMLDRDDTPWYPTITLLRQKQYGNWNSIFQHAAEQLKILMEKQYAR